MSVVQDLKTDLIQNAIALYSAKMVTLEEGRLMVNEDFEIVPEELLMPDPTAEVPMDGEKAEEGGQDMNAEAQAKLRGSVGGVQGILETQAAVAGGTTTYSAGISLLTVVYGFDEATARALLGEESEIQANIAAQNEAQAQAAPTPQGNEA